jgi:hypothetical protein
MKKFSRAIFLVSCLFFLNSSHSQSLKDQLEAQKKFDLLEKMREKDEKEIAEFEKSKNSALRNILSDNGFRIFCERLERKGSRAHPSAGEFSALLDIRSFFSNAIVFEKNLYSVSQCNRRNREEKFCAIKIGQVSVNNSDVEYSTDKNPGRNDSEFNYGKIKDWHFDGASNTLIVKYGDRNTSLFEMSCVRSKWLDD